jgi:hypothetical protein
LELLTKVKAPGNYHKITDVLIHISTHLKKKMLIANLVTFFTPKTHFPIERHENKEKSRLYFGHIILLPIQSQLFEIENPKNPKTDSLKYRYPLLNWYSPAWTDNKHPKPLNIQYNSKIS